jgi:ubiquinone/menaquinone biosynthesis C-methylase UbiE
VFLIDGFLEPDIPFEHFTKSDFTEKLPYEDDCFAAVSCLEVIEHVENRYLLMNEMLRVLKKEGVMIISTPNIDTLVGKIFFFFTGNLIGFTKRDGLFETFPAHINPFYLPSVLAYYDGKISLTKIYYSVWKIPFF